MHQRGGLEGLSGSFLRHPGRRQPAQFFIAQRKQLVGGFRVTQLGHPHYRLSGPGTVLHVVTARSVYRGVSGHPARASQEDHSPRRNPFPCVGRISIRLSGHVGCDEGVWVNPNNTSTVGSIPAKKAQAAYQRQHFIDREPSLINYDSRDTWFECIQMVQLLA